MTEKTEEQTCTKCGKPSIPGLIRGSGKCQFHWNEGVWGTAWAKEVEARAAIKAVEGEKT